MIDGIDWLLLYLVLNCLSFLAYADDKRRAQQAQWRIREGSLLWFALFGAPGAQAARMLLRHKTRKEPFRSQFRTVAVWHGALALLSVPGVATSIGSYVAI
jgi:uncharacterized membrane protein YsdA (DUF1294 family)